MAPVKPMKHAPRGRLKARPDPIGRAHPVRRAPPREDRPRCTAHGRTTKKPCGRSPIPGGTVCRYHGGAAPQVRQAALARLEAYQDRAIDRLFGLIEQKEFPSTAMQGVKDVLDRTMGRAHERVEIGRPGEFDRLSREELQRVIEQELAPAAGLRLVKAT